MNIEITKEQAIKVAKELDVVTLLNIVTEKSRKSVSNVGILMAATPKPKRKYNMKNRNKKSVVKTTPMPVKRGRGRPKTKK